MLLGHKTFLRKLEKGVIELEKGSRPAFIQNTPTDLGGKRDSDQVNHSDNSVENGITTESEKKEPQQGISTSGWTKGWDHSLPF